MRLAPEELESAGYRMYSQLDHEEIIPFVQDQLGGNHWIARVFRRLVPGLLALALIYLAFAIAASPGDWKAILGQFALGLGLSVMLAPIHELIHGVALWAVGAPRVQYRANWKKLYFMAGADRFVVDEREFYWIAFAPFAVISLLAIGLLLWQPPTALGLLFLHTAFCAGDFALADFMNANSAQGIVTYDLMEEGETFFFVKM